MPSIADTYVTIFPETSKIAEGVRRAFRELDDDALKAGRRWGKDIERGMGKPEVPVDADTAPAKVEVKKLKREVNNTRASIKVDVDKGSMNAAAAAVRAVSTNLTATAAGIGAVLSPNAIAATGNAIVALSGSLGLIPAVAGTAGLAIGSLKIATLGFADALKEVRDPEKFAEAIAQLSPNAQEAARAIQGMMPAIDQLKFTVQDAFSQGFGQQIQQLGSTYLPMFQTVMSQIAASANSALTQVSQALQMPGRQADLSAMTGNMAGAFDQLSQALAPLVKSFVDIGLVGSGFLPELAAAAKDAAIAFSQFIGEARATGDLQQWIQTGLNAMKQLGGVIQNVGSIFMSVFQSGADVGGGLLDSLLRITQVFADFLNSPAGQGALTSFMLAVHDTLVALAPAASSLLQALAPLVGVLGTALAGAIQAIAPALTTWFTAMQPVISQLSAALLPVIQAIAPVLAQLAMMLANQMVAGIQQILPVLVPFVQQMGNLLIAVLPLVPPMTRLVMSMLPIMQQIVAAILPFLTRFVELLTNLATAVVPPLVGVLGALADSFKTQFDAIKTAVTTVWNVIEPIFSAMKTAVETVLKPMGALLGAFPSAASNAQSSLNAALPAPAARGGATIPVAPAPLPGLAPGTYRRRDGSTAVIPNAATAPTTSSLPIPAVSTYVAPPPAAASSSKSGGSGATSGYTSDAALLAGVPAGSYSRPGSGAWDLQQGLADCSSAVEDLVNMIDGRSTGGRSMATGNAAEWLTSHGFMPGTMPGAFNVGFNSSHMQATLPGGTPFNWGSDAAAARGGVGGTGAFDPAFTSHYYRPVSGAPSAMYPASSTMGLDSGGGMGVTGDPATDKKLRDAQQRVDDRTNAVTRAQMRYDEVMAKGTSTALQRKTAEDALAKAQRERADAVTDLQTAEQKATEGKTGKAGGSTGGEQLGQDIMSGIGEIFGLGDLFKDPTEFGLFKIFKGIMGLKPAEGGVQGGDGASLMPGAGGGGGLGGILGMVPQAFGNLNVGSPQDAPGQFMPAIGGPGSSASGPLPNMMMTSPFAPPGAPGPGNQPGGATINMQGSNFGYSPTQVQDQIQQGQLQASRQPLRALPSP